MGLVEKNATIEVMNLEKEARIAEGIAEGVSTTDILDDNVLKARDALNNSIKALRVTMVAPGFLLMQMNEAANQMTSANQQYGLKYYSSRLRAERAEKDRQRLGSMVFQKAKQTKSLKGLNEKLLQRIHDLQI